MIKKDIQNRTIIIAEAGVNHYGSLERALEMIDVAANAGADIIKFQTFNAKQVIGQNTPKANYQVRNTGDAESMLEMAQKLELDSDAHHALMYHCKERNIEFLSSMSETTALVGHKDTVLALAHHGSQNLLASSSEVTAVCIFS